MTAFEPRLVSWNVTRRCNLRCAHCYLDADSRASSAGELTTAEGRELIDQLADLCPGAMLVFSGGEPLLRDDLCDLVAHAAQRGLIPVLGTNAVLLTDPKVRELAASGLSGVGLSLDSLDPRMHDDFRGTRGAWRRTVAGMESCVRNDLAVQIHTTATTSNCDEIPALIAFAADHGATAFNLFFLVCTGRGEEMTDISPGQYEAALDVLADAGERYLGRMVVRARCAPHFRRIVHGHSASSSAATAGCMAGTTYCRVTPEGMVTPCPYLPLPAGNLRTEPLADIWETAPVLLRLREPALQGRCGVCEFRTICGGCRARAFAVTGNLMAEDPWCAYQPDPDALPLVDPAPAPAIEWTAEARARLERVPVALRSMIESGVTAYAHAKGATTITPDLMAEVRARAPGTGASTLSRSGPPPTRSSRGS